MKTKTILVAITLVLVAFWGCSDDSGTGPVDENNENVIDLFYYNFDSESSDWIFDIYEYPFPHGFGVSDSISYSGTGCVLAYGSNADGWAGFHGTAGRIFPINLNDYSAATLSFYTKYFISNDHPLSSNRGIYFNLFHHGDQETILWRKVYAEDTDWHKIEISLDGYCGIDTELYFQFYFMMDGEDQLLWGIDDFRATVEQ